MEKRTTFLVILGLILGLILGFVLGVSITPAPGPSPQVQSKKQIRERARKNLVKELREKGFIPPEPEQITDISGTVTELKPNTLSLKPEQRFGDPLGEFFPDTMLVKATDKTKIYKIKEKDPEVLRKEEQEFNQKVQQYEQAGKEIPPDLVPPEPFIKEKVKLSEIEPGQRVRITADENIKGKSEFEAATIEFEVRSLAQ